MNETITVYGAGSWGTTLAVHLARKGYGVRVWDRDIPHLERLHRDRQNRKHLPETVFPDSLEVLYEHGAPPDPSPGWAVVVVPSQAVRSLLQGIRGTPGGWIVASKGLEVGTGLTMSAVVEQVRGETEKVVVLAGPSLALEVAAEKPAAVLAASRDLASARRVQTMFATEHFRVYTSSDPLGVELATALKNVIALAAGIADGLDLGQNARGALLTRGLAEIRRLGETLGAHQETFLGLAGVGDLVTTCTSPLSRNHTLGEALGRGERLEPALDRIGMIVEGVHTARAACELADRLGIELPITRQVARILFEGTPPATALRELMTRPLRPE